MSMLRNSLQSVTYVLASTISDVVAVPPSGDGEGPLSAIVRGRAAEET